MDIVGSKWPLPGNLTSNVLATATSRLAVSTEFKVLALA